MGPPSRAHLSWHLQPGFQGLLTAGFSSVQLTPAAGWLSCALGVVFPDWLLGGPFELRR